MAVQATQSNMPVVILKDGASQSKGLEAQKTTFQQLKLSLKLYVQVWVQEEWIRCLLTHWVM